MRSTSERLGSGPVAKGIRATGGSRGRCGEEIRGRRGARRWRARSERSGRRTRERGSRAVDGCDPVGGGGDPSSEREAESCPAARRCEGSSSWLSLLFTVWRSSSLRGRRLRLFRSVGTVLRLRPLQMNGLRTGRRASSVTTRTAWQCLCCWCRRTVRVSRSGWCRMTTDSRLKCRA